MPPTAVNVAAILLLVLPGFLSYRFAVWRRADPTHRSPLWQLSEILEHSAYVHLIGAGLVGVIHSVLQWWFGLDSYAKFLLQNGPNSFLDKHFIEAVLWFILYPVYVILASSILGSYDVPQRVSSFIIKGLGIPSRWKWMRWLPVPKDPYPQEPVWHYAFNIMRTTRRRPYRHRRPAGGVPPNPPLLSRNSLHAVRLITYLQPSDR